MPVRRRDRPRLPRARDLRRARSPPTRSARASAGVPARCSRVPNAAVGADPPRPARLARRCRRCASGRGRCACGARRRRPRRVPASASSGSARATRRLARGGRRRRARATRRLAQLALRRRAARLHAARDERGYAVVGPRCGGRSAGVAASSSGRPASSCADCGAQSTGARHRARRRRRGRARRYARAGYVPTPRTFTRARQVARPGASPSRRGRTSSSATSTSCEAGSSSSPSRSTRRTRCSGRPWRSSARSRRGSTRSSCSPTAPSTACCPDNCRVHLFGAGSQGRARRPLRGGARPASCAAARSPSSRTSCPLYAILAAPLVAAARVPLLLWFTHWKRAARSCSPSASRPRCSPSTAARSRSPRRKVVPIGHGIDIEAFRCVEREPGRAAARRRARAHLAGEGARDDRPRGRAARRCRARGARARRARAERSQRAERERLASAAGAGRARRPGAARAAAGAARAQGRARQQHARGRARQGRLRGGGDVHAGARVEHRLRRRLPPELRFPRDDAGRPGREAARASPRCRTPSDSRRPRAARAVVERHSVEHWADEVLEVAKP